MEMLRVWASSHLKIQKEQSLLKNVFITELVNSPVTCQDVIEKTLYLVMFWNITVWIVQKFWALFDPFPCKKQ